MEYKKFYQKIDWKIYVFSIDILGFVSGLKKKNLYTFQPELK